ncbi:MAG: T9SS type A sorting domain-containing protein [Ignavibacteria bacterium]|nr:T9SS type A sorting domain-containing protein [Ignavibacteria bacterium]
MNYLNIIITSVVLFILSTINSYSQISKITPFIYDIKGVNAYENVVIAFGNFGVATLSFDKGQNWIEVNIDGGHNIVNMVYKNSSLIAFLENGEIKSSLDEGKTWELKLNINDTIIASRINKNNFVIRTLNKIIVLDNGYGIKEQISLQYKSKFNYDSEFAFVNNPPLQISEDKIYTFLDSNILIYNMNLELESTISIGESKYGISRIYLANNKIYVVTNNELREIDEESNTNIFLTFNKNSELFNEIEPSIYYLRVFDNKFYCFNAIQDNNNFPTYAIYIVENSKSASRLGQVDCSTLKKNFVINDIAIFENDFYFVANGKFLVKYNYKSSESNRISDFTSFSSSGGYLPLRINNDLAIHRNENNYYKLVPSTNKVKRIETETNFTGINILYDNYDIKNKELQVLAFDPKNNKELLLFTSLDLGESFKKSIILGYDPLKYVQITGFERVDNGYMIASYFKSFVAQKNELKLFDSNFNLVSNSVDSIYRNIKVGLINDTFYRINQDTSFFKKTYLQTSLDGKKWDELAIYGHSDEDTVLIDEEKYFTFSTPDFRISKEAKSSNKQYLINYLYSENDSLFTVQRINIVSKEIDTLLYNKVLTLDYGVTDAFDLYKDTINIIVNDTLYILDIEAEKNKIRKIVFPDNGAVIQRFFKRFESRNLFTYIDNKHEIRNYWFTINRGNGTSSIEKIEVPPYFYNSAPFPLPTSTYVSTKIYMDNNVTITKESIKIYDINGTQVENGANIEISNTIWPTTLTWDSSNQPPGVYFILIEYDGNSKAIKVMKE